ncbi:MAG: DUF4870 domain-containing protein [Acidobacteria bacterium]|nr:DUF4870 domain-containing protein [Acidobacteriota bacterium]
MDATGQVITQDDRTLAALTHLSGLSGYVIPLGGILVPIIIWAVKKDSEMIATIAKQAIILNVAVFVLVFVSAILWITIILIPLVLLFWCALALVALALPIIGAIKANQGEYYRYPMVGLSPGA